MACDIKLPKHVKAKWVKALRSGEYEQCQRRLADFKGGFCCLGVLQHVLDDGKIDLNEHGLARTFMSFETEQNLGVYHALNQQTKNKGGYSVCVRDKLASMNDGGYEYPTTKSFKEISDWIARNL
jgi:hypothetical protein